jgi:predicted RNA-binding Zn-ribbon protein involved in translation (DUF1610 family)
MPISFECHVCGKKLKAPDDAVGKSSKCPGCGTRVTCPEPVYDAEVAEISDEAAEIVPSSDLDDGKPYGVVESEPAAPPASEPRKPCPMCGEMIIATAAKCRFCGEIFDPTLKKAGRGGKRSDLRQIATAQRFLIICILCQVVAYGISAAVQRQQPPSPLVPVAGLLLLAAWICGAVCAFTLAIKLYKTALGIFLGVLTLIPCLGLFILLLINSRATNTLKENGINVGFFGASGSDI